MPDTINPTPGPGLAQPATLPVTPDPATAAASTLLGSPAPGAPAKPVPLQTADVTKQQLTPPAPAQPPNTISVHKSVLQRLAGDAAKWSGFHVVKQLMGGDTQPSAPGQPPRQKPGALFRNLLAAALVGGAAGQEEHNRNPYMGFAGGLAVGGSAEIENLQKQRAQQQQFDLEKQQGQTRESEADARAKNDSTKFQAQLAHWSNEELVSTANLNLVNKRELDSENAQSNAILGKVLSEHGTLASIPENGLPGNGAKLMDLITKNPALLNGPAGSTRVTVKTVDTNGLEYDALHHGWKTADGKPVNLEDVTTWRVFDIPNKVAKETVQLTGAELKKLFPAGVGGVQVADDGKYNVPVDALFSLGAKERSQARQSQHAEVTSQRETLNTKARIVSDQLAGLRAQLSSIADKESPEADSLRRQIGALNGQLSDLMSGINPYFKGPASAKHPATIQNRILQAERIVDWSKLPKGATAMLGPQGQVNFVPAKQVASAKSSGWTELVPPTGGVTGSF